MNHQSNPHQEWEGTTAVERQGLLKQRLRTAASSLSRIMPHRQSWTNRWKDSDCDKSSKTKRLVKSLIVKEIESLQEHSILYDHSSIKCKRNHTKQGTSKKHAQKKSIKKNDKTTTTVPITSPCPSLNDGQDHPHPLTTEDRSSMRCIDCNEPCPICWDVYRVSEKVCWSKNRACSHGFHLDCIITWLESHDGCPMCRAEYIES